MNGQRKPRVVRYPATGNTLAIALARATKLTPAEIAGCLTPLRAALVALREGRATEMEWMQVASAANVSLSIEKKGVVRGLIEHLTTADQALFNINQRAMATGRWKSPTLYFYEIEALATYVSLYAFQLGNLSAQEYDQAWHHAKAETARLGGLLFNVEAQATQQPVHA